MFFFSSSFLSGFFLFLFLSSRFSYFGFWFFGFCVNFRFILRFLTLLQNKNSIDLLVRDWIGVISKWLMSLCCELNDVSYSVRSDLYLSVGSSNGLFFLLLSVVLDKTIRNFNKWHIWIILLSLWQNEAQNERKKKLKLNRMNNIAVYNPTNNS